MGEKAATKEVIGALLIALRDGEDSVRYTACETLGNMGEKAATKEILGELVIALDAANVFVGLKAGEALCRIGKRAPTKKVIGALVTALGNANVSVRKEACEALGNMGKDAATSSVVCALLAVADRDGYESLRKILNSSSALSEIDSVTISKLLELWNRGAWFTRDIPLEKIMRAYVNTGIPQWCPVISLHSLQTDCAITIVENTVIVYGNSEPVKFVIPSSTLRDELVRALSFANQTDLV
ncbi:unnamed protein product [Didymodactylos carnosus]|uniref:Uncharacterized protein n=1 Tax=Didymodactylos carnosus TaxID=1234261 RepID=A0A8S2FX81_9BILA|nr:unnamed protein product [Didymodactylos carnosus]CAF4358446.1 unnamed protein product [Didymodactylos carnosus]